MFRTGNSHCPKAGYTLGDMLQENVSVYMYLGTRRLVYSEMFPVSGVGIHVSAAGRHVGLSRYRTCSIFWEHVPRVSG